MKHCKKDRCLLLTDNTFHKLVVEKRIRKKTQFRKNVLISFQEKETKNIDKKISQVKILATQQTFTCSKSAKAAL